MARTSSGKPPLIAGTRINELTNYGSQYTGLRVRSPYNPELIGRITITHKWSQMPSKDGKHISWDNYPITKIKWDGKTTQELAQFRNTNCNYEIIENNRPVLEGLDFELTIPKLGIPLGNEGLPRYFDKKRFRSVISEIGKKLRQLKQEMPNAYFCINMNYKSQRGYQLDFYYSIEREKDKHPIWKRAFTAMLGTGHGYLRDYYLENISKAFDVPCFTEARVNRSLLKTIGLT